jgi:hypothetical protein
MRIGSVILVAVTLAFGSVIGAARTSAQDLENDSNQLKAMRDALVKRWGDVKTQVEEKNGAQFYSYEYVPPKEGEGKRRGFAAAEEEYKKAAWKGIQLILNKYCTFKKDNPNFDKDIYKKERPADLLKPASGAGSSDDKCSTSNLHKCQQDASAPDIAISVQFIDQIMRLMVSTKEFSEVDCGQFGESAKMPDVAPGSSASFDKCGDGDQHCYRNMVLYNAVRIIALSKTLHLMRYDMGLLEGLAQNQSDQAATELLVNRALQGVNVDTAIEDNKETWIHFTNLLGKIAQGQAAGSVFRPMVSQGSSNQ